jgi:protein-arginine kinase activator protein McsA
LGLIKLNKMLSEDLPYDIIFLQIRLEELVDKEEYEKAAVIKRWIDELMIFYKVNSKKILK